MKPTAKRTLAAFADLAAFHRGEHAPAQESIEYVAERLHEYVARRGQMSLDEVFAVAPAGRGKRDPWRGINAATILALYCFEMGVLRALGFTIDEAAAAVAGQYASLAPRFKADGKAISAGTARAAFYRLGGDDGENAKAGRVEAQRWDEATKAARLKLISEHHLPPRFCSRK